MVSVHPHLLDPSTITISFTDTCNLHCAYCYSDCRSQPSPQELSTDQWLMFIDYLMRNNFMAAYFEGGEPLCRADFLEILRASSRSMMTWLRTHATLIDRNLARRLKQAGLGGAFVELMGATPATHELGTGVAGSFEATCRGVRHLRAADIDTRLVVILTRRTATELNDILMLADDLEVAQVSVLRLYPIGRAKQRWGELALSLDEQMAALESLRPPPGVRVAHSWHPHDKNCCWNSVTVNAHGDSIGCPYLREFVNYGNVLATPLLDGWHADPLYRRLRSGRVDAACGGCETREGSRGGCRATAFAFSRRWDAPDPFCTDMNQSVDLQVLPDWLLDRPAARARDGTTTRACGPRSATRGRHRSSGPMQGQPADGRPGSYRLVPGTRVREVPERDVCMVYTPAGPALYALQDEAWLILRECLGRTRDELIRSYVAQVAAVGVAPEEATLETLQGISDLQSKRIVEEVPRARASI
jgi:radical SAM protein with 4Fe4S-binding SPASM domain